jgi:hypothetical protein
MLESMHFLAVAACSALTMAASAQTLPTATITLNWKNTGSTVSAPTRHPIEPGQSIDIWVDVAWTGAGMSFPGGIVTGFGLLFMDIVGTRAGVWAGSESPTMNGFGGTTGVNPDRYGRQVDPEGGWRTGPWVLNPEPVSGSYLTDLYAGQFPVPGTVPINPVNPINEIMRLRWTPLSYDAGTVSFISRKASSPTGSGAGVFLLDPVSGLITFEYLGFTDVTWGTLPAIPIIPAPTTLTVLLCGVLLSHRVRRSGAVPACPVPPGESRSQHHRPRR